MSRTVTRDALVDRIRRATDTEQETFVTDADLAERVDESMTELYDLLIAGHGQEYYAKSADLLTQSGESSYDLDDDFYKMLAIVGLDGSTWIDIPRFDNSEYAKLLSHSGSVKVTDIRYRISGIVTSSEINASIEILPTPTSALAIEYRFIPTVMRLDDDGDITYDGVNGWESYVVWDVAAQILAKIKEDPSFALEERAKVVRRISGLSAGRDHTKPNKVQRTARAPYGRMR